MNPLNNIRSHGQSIWLDLLDREIMNSGKLQSLIDNDDLRGLTSNPSIFEKAITGSSDYDHDIAKLSQAESDNAAIFFDLAIADIQRAADIFKPVFDKTGGKDGFVSLEVSPYLARDTDGTIQQARELWKRVDRKNVMIKIPGTKEGLTAIRECLREGININVTLLFGLPRYHEITEAFMGGLEDRLKEGNSIKEISSVASFFLSRIDVMVDPMLEEKGSQNLKGKIAIASAKKAYQIYLEMIASDRFKKLEEKGAQKQRVLYASTGTKDPSFSDVLYVESIIGKDTINTLPIETIDAFRDHGKVADTLTQDIDSANKAMVELQNKGIDIDKITQKLEDEGIEKFNQAYEKLIKSIDSQKRKL
ncbi:transaldolase [Kaistella jeonii]|uniref:Transaldolase n=1 Tax=Kaistella jeonii TaxID=266749 RepID=A0A0C1EYW0_9FLAO|nr:transaldolase [Kaistella jeonii]KIA86022.1 transaldolase [Kaistella jeonii]SFC36635.1 transaldolase/transaldolase / glucose-6-phosphate isomerase [Kaistella jeonii]VEI97291.1 Transaldolase [Kaistella jeonii]